jgi:hypothetical protein
MCAKSPQPLSTRANVVNAGVACELLCKRPGRHLGAARCPVLIVMPEADDVMPPSVTRSVAAQAGSSASAGLLCDCTLTRACLQKWNLLSSPVAIMTLCLAARCVSFWHRLYAYLRLFFGRASTRTSPPRCRSYSAPRCNGGSMSDRPCLTIV